MKKSKELMAVRLLEERLKSASPSDARKIAKDLVELKDDWLNR